MGNQSSDDLLTTAQAAKLLGVSPQQVRAHARGGRLTGKLIGRDWVFKRADVEAFTPSKPGRPATGKTGEN